MSLRICFATFFLLTASPALLAAEPSFLPKHFNAYIGGFMGGSFRLELHADVLTYTTFGGGFSDPRRTVIKPTAAQWRELRQALDELKVWQWRPAYPSNGTADGTQWSLDIAYADHAIKTRGDNNFPDAAGKPNGDPTPTPAFSHYLDAVSKLIGGKTFR